MAKTRAKIKLSAGRRGIQSVEIGIGVLSALAAEAKGVTLSAISARTGLSASQTHRYLQSLVASGMVVQNPLTGLYDLGATARRIGTAALNRFDVFSSIEATIPGLVRLTGRTVLVAVWGSGGPTLLRWYFGDPPVLTNITLGSVLPMFNSATGRAFIAFGSETNTRPIIAREIEQSRINLGEKDIALIREEGHREMCISLGGKLIPGMRAVAAPVFDLQGGLVLVISAIAHWSFPVEDDPAVAEALKRVCKHITEDSGGSWPEHL